MTEILNDPIDELKKRVKKLQWHGLFEQWDELNDADFIWIKNL